MRVQQLNKINSCCVLSLAFKPLIIIVYLTKSLLNAFFLMAPKWSVVVVGMCDYYSHGGKFKWCMCYSVMPNILDSCFITSLCVDKVSSWFVCLCWFGQSVCVREGIIIICQIISLSCPNVGVYAVLHSDGLSIVDASGSFLPGSKYSMRHACLPVPIATLVPIVSLQRVFKRTSLLHVEGDWLPLMSCTSADKLVSDDADEEIYRCYWFGENRFLVFLVSSLLQRSDHRVRHCFLTMCMLAPLGGVITSSVTKASAKVYQWLVAVLSGRYREDAAVMFQLLLYLILWSDGDFWCASRLSKYRSLTWMHFAPKSGDAVTHDRYRLIYATPARRSLISRVAPDTCADHATSRIGCP